MDTDRLPFRLRPSAKFVLTVVKKAVLAVCVAAIAARAETLTVATYNIENYVAAGRRVDGAYRPDYPKPEVAKQALRTVIRALGADVLALQEIGPAGYLEELRRDLRAEGLDYPHVALGEAADAERHVAVLSRRPFRRVAAHAGLDFRYFDGREKVKRGLLEVAVEVADGELAVFVMHLKSRLTERPDDPEAARRRAGEAAAIRDLILRRFPDPTAARFLLVGDCNDTAGSRPVRLLTQRGGNPVARAVEAADSRGDSWTYTYRRDGSYLRFDFVLVSPALWPAVAGGAGQVYDGPGVREASDHRPVLVRLDLGGKPARLPDPGRP
jgi:endonuclease/exonuclease/phosphatase family metal-dependent hydrolase